MFDAVACETEARSCLRLAKKETDPVVKLLLRSMARRRYGKGARWKRYGV